VGRAALDERDAAAGGVFQGFRVAAIGLNISARSFDRDGVG
jgi:hypothetical protein